MSRYMMLISQIMLPSTIFMTIRCGDCPTQPKRHPYKLAHRWGARSSSAETRARFLSLAPSKLRLCLANHRPGYWCNLACDWQSTAWAYSEQETENGPRSSHRSHCKLPKSGSRVGHRSSLQEARPSRKRYKGDFVLTCKFIQGGVKVVAYTQGEHQPCVDKWIMTKWFLRCRG